MARVGIFVITNLDIPRWRQELATWEYNVKLNKPGNFEIHFIKCAETDEKCVDSYIPGIYQKSVIAFKRHLGKYDIYIRTNLSTWFDLERLQQLCMDMNTNKAPLYGGTIVFDWGISGSGIFLNKASMKILMKDGFTSQYFHDKNTPDDVVIGKIMSKNKVSMNTQFPTFFYWNETYTFPNNIAMINKHVYSRLKEMPLHFHSIVRKNDHLSTKVVEHFMINNKDVFVNDIFYSNENVWKVLRIDTNTKHPYSNISVVLIVLIVLIIGYCCCINHHNITNEFY